jgi:hypothetical protein
MIKYMIIYIMAHKFELFEGFILHTDYLYAIDLKMIFKLPQDGSPVYYKHTNGITYVLTTLPRELRHQYPYPDNDESKSYIHALEQSKTPEDMLKTMTEIHPLSGIELDELFPKFRTKGDLSFRAHTFKVFNGYIIHTDYLYDTELSMIFKLPKDSFPVYYQQNSTVYVFTPQLSKLNGQLTNNDESNAYIQMLEQHDIQSKVLETMTRIYPLPEFELNELFPKFRTEEIVSEPKPTWPLPESARLESAHDPLALVIRNPKTNLKKLNGRRIHKKYLVALFEDTPVRRIFEISNDGKPMIYMDNKSDTLYVGILPTVSTTEETDNSETNMLMSDMQARASLDFVYAMLKPATVLTPLTLDELNYLFPEFSSTGSLKLFVRPQAELPDKFHSHKMTERQKKKTQQIRPISSIPIPALTGLMEDEAFPSEIHGDKTLNHRFAPDSIYFGKVDRLYKPIGEGTVIDRDGVELFSRNWEKTGEITFTCTNGLMFLARCDFYLTIQLVYGILAWGTSRMNMFELEKYLDSKTYISKTLYHALDVVDSGWGDNSAYTWNYIQQYTGVVRVIAMCHGCIATPFTLKNKKLHRYNNTPHGVCSYLSFKESISLLQLFDRDIDAFNQRIIDITTSTCKESEFRSEHFTKYKAACANMSSLFYKQFEQGQLVMNRGYSGPGYNPVFMGYQADDGGWKYVNVFAHIESGETTLEYLLDKCSKCSECILIDLSCAAPCASATLTQTALDSTGGTRRQKHISKRNARRRVSKRTPRKRGTKRTPRRRAST